MPAKKRVVKKTSKKATKKVMPAKKAGLFAGTSVFGWMVIGLAIGGLIVLLRYLVISWMMPADIYLIEPAVLVPGMTL